jgi:hypothetical protein
LLFLTPGAALLEGDLFVGAGQVRLTCRPTETNQTVPRIFTAILPGAAHDLRAIRLAVTMFLRSPASCQP